LDELARSLDMEIKVRFTEPRRRQRMAVMVTKEPHCLQKIIEPSRPVAFQGRGGPGGFQPPGTSNRWPGAPALSFSFVPWDDRARAEENVLRLLESMK
jgi:formyltetrahydrofolate deformylase